MFCVARKTLFVVEKTCQAKFAQTLTGQRQDCIHLIYLIYVLILKGCHRTTIKVFNRLQKHLDGEKPGWRNYMNNNPEFSSSGLAKLTKYNENMSQLSTLPFAIRFFVCQAENLQPE